MYKQISITIIMSFLLGIFYWAVFVPKDDVNEKISKTLLEQREKADLFMKGVTFSETADGRKYWEIKAVTSKINNDTGNGRSYGCIRYFLQERKTSMNFLSPAVVWDMKKRKISIKSATGLKMTISSRPLFSPGRSIQNASLPKEKWFL